MANIYTIYVSTTSSTYWLAKNIASRYGWTGGTYNGEPWMVIDLYKGKVSYTYQPPKTSNTSIKVATTLTDITSNIPSQPNIPTIPELIAQFSYSSSLVGPVGLSFINESSYNGTGNVSYLWTFGDGTTSTRQYPVAHVYDTGSYTASLLLNESVYKMQSLYTQSFNIIIPSVVASFDISYPSGAVAPAIAMFTNTSIYTGSIWTYRWDFGTGNLTSSLQTPTNVTYTETGSFMVYLSITGSHGATSAYSKSVVVTEFPG